MTFASKSLTLEHWLCVGKKKYAELFVNFFPNEITELLT
jgi:hypothetical protein